MHNDNGDLIGIVSGENYIFRAIFSSSETDRKDWKVFSKTDVAEHLVDIIFEINAKLLLFSQIKITVLA